MKREIIETGDGSKTIFVPELGEQYHSIHGALVEAQHVFLKNGLHAIDKQQISILEMGFGTGLNAFLTFLENISLGKNIRYTALEAFPVESDLLNQLDYVKTIGAEKRKGVFEQMHDCGWGVEEQVSDQFCLHKIVAKLQEVEFENSFDLIYFDAFSPGVQPELWSEEIFGKLYAKMNKGGVLVTYCAKGSVKRALKAVGFQVESLEGPPGKREMTRAKKSN